MGPLEKWALRHVLGVSMQVLVVDDEPDLRSLVRAIFRRERVEVTDAADGATAIALFSAGAFDVVLLDFRLPDMQGDELLRRLREIDPLARVVVLTAEASDIAGAGRLIEGADAYFVKPFSVRELVATVTELANEDLTVAVAPGLYR